VAYHVELRRSLRRAWLFNLDAEALREQVLNPWSSGAGVEVADRRWDVQESTIRVLEGPHLAAADLAHGQGWNRAEHVSRDVTQEVLAAGAATVVSPTRAGHELGVGLLRELGVAAVDWGEVRASLLAGGPHPGADAALVMAAAEPGPWLFDAGLALGAFGPRAVVVAADAGAPAQLAGVAVLPADANALAERLR
jgi:hypothetical protein